MKWSDMGIPKDQILECPECNHKTLQKVIIDHDEESRCCYKCDCHFYYKAEGKELVLIRVVKPDVDREAYDRKRTRDHGHWRKRWKK